MRKVVATFTQIFFIITLFLSLDVRGQYAYITNGGTNTISVIDTKTKVVIKTILDIGGASGIAVSPDGTNILAVNIFYQ